VPKRDLPHYVSLFRSGQLPVDKLLTHKLTLDEINEGFDRMREGQGIRQIVMFD
jgi:alcohol dehydrogenase